MDQLKFALRQVVKLVESGETGKVIARSESIEHAPLYLVRYRDAQGKQTENWWSESALVAL